MANPGESLAIKELLFHGCWLIVKGAASKCYGKHPAKVDLRFDHPVASGVVQVKWEARRTYDHQVWNDLFDFATGVGCLPLWADRIIVPYTDKRGAKRERAAMCWRLITGVHEENQPYENYSQVIDLATLFATI